MIRSVLCTILCFAVVSTARADPQDSAAARLAVGRLIDDEITFGELIRGRSTDAQLDTEPVEDSADQEADENEDRQRRDSMISRLAVLKKPASEISIRATADGTTPSNRAEQLSQYESMILISAIGATPVGPNRYTICFTHRPLYYEQRNLERCGRGYGCCQNGVSGAQFLWNTMLLPYHLRHQRCDTPVAVGGDCLTRNVSSATGGE